ncbi:sulfatase family protein [Pontiella agarivorans]|uniref:Sulfatase n=1 Tax=Pontiella agarivorans TaxID=3038953 RepID=A0ABU5MV62_9BACT|nr:sulfatase [Pontiella agarivorans]MDZ8117836.1 sulfatase [Pontiella agarivorans]
MLFAAKINIAVLSGILCASVVLGGDKPNILFVMSDDHAAQAIAAYNSRLAYLNPCPTIDALADAGVVMENAFCQNSICTPSRASILTGQSSAMNGCTILNDPLPPERQYLAHEMKAAGYQTAVIGKWHLVARPDAFDYFKVLPKQGDYFDPTFKVADGTVKMEGHCSDLIADSALDWFKTIRDTDKPFFLMLHFKAPHGKFEYAPRYEGYLQDVTIPEPGNLRDRKNFGSVGSRGHNNELDRLLGASVGRRHPRFNNVEPKKRWPWAAKLDLSMNDEELQGAAYQEYLKAYLRCVKGVDDNLNRVLNYLKSEGLYENTIIFYTGDQGFYLGEHDLIDKRWPYEEGMRMPFIVHYPKSIKPGRSDAIVENIDYAPTLLDYAGVATPSYMHGKSFRSILETGEESNDWKKAAYYHYWMHMKQLFVPGCIAIRTKRYKLIQFYGCKTDESAPSTPPSWELYDLKADPTEDNNVYDNPEYAAVIADLKKQLKERRAELGEDDKKFACNQVINEYWDYSPEQRGFSIRMSNKLAKKGKTKSK